MVVGVFQTWLRWGGSRVLIFLKSNKVTALTTTKTMKIHKLNLKYFYFTVLKFEVDTH